MTDAPGCLRADFAAKIAAWQKLFERISEGVLAMPPQVVQAVALSAGLTPTNVRLGLLKTFSGLKRAAGSLRQREIPPAAGKKIMILSASHLPGASIAPAVLMASAGCQVYVKVHAMDQALFLWLLGSYREQMGDQGAGGIELICCHHDEPLLRKQLRKVDAILVYGRDATIEKLRREYGCKVFGFGQKFSVAYLSEPLIDADTADGLALDVALFEQRGCLSLQALFIAAPYRKAAEWLDFFTPRLEKIVSDLQPHEVDPGLRLRRHGLVERLILQDAIFRVDKYGRWLAMLTPEFAPEMLLGSNTLQIVPVDDVRQFLAQVGPFKTRLQGCALAGRATSANDFRGLLGELGFSLLCSPGELQAPPLDWKNEGLALPHDLLAELR